MGENWITSYKLKRRMILTTLSCKYHPSPLLWATNFPSMPLISESFGSRRICAFNSSTCFCTDFLCPLHCPKCLLLCEFVWWEHIDAGFQSVFSNLRQPWPSGHLDEHAATCSPPMSVRVIQDPCIAKGMSTYLLKDVFKKNFKQIKSKKL